MKKYICAICGSEVISEKPIQIGLELVCKKCYQIEMIIEGGDSL